MLFEQLTHANCDTDKPASVFWWTFFGLFISQFFVELLGVGLMTAVTGSDAFQSAYDAAGVGGLTGEVFKGYSSSVAGFGKFIQVILSFSVLGVVIGQSQSPCRPTSSSDF